MGTIQKLWRDNYCPLLVQSGHCWILTRSHRDDARGPRCDGRRFALLFKCFCRHVHGVPARHERGEADGKLQKRVKNVHQSTRSPNVVRSCTIISNRSLASLASSTPMAFACRRSSDLVLGESSLIACALVMPPLQHDSTGPVL
jgi:hypothetical protein